MIPASAASTNPSLFLSAGEVEPGPPQSPNLMPASAASTAPSLLRSHGKVGVAPNSSSSNSSCAIEGHQVFFGAKEQHVDGRTTFAVGDRPVERLPYLLSVTTYLCRTAVHLVSLGSRTGWSSIVPVKVPFPESLSCFTTVTMID